MYVVLCASLLCVFLQLFVTWNMQQTDLTASLSHLNLGFTLLLFITFVFYAEKLISLDFFQFFSRQLSAVSFGFLFESVVSNYLVIHALLD